MADVILTEEQETRAGEDMARVLGLRKKRNGRYSTSWGDKTDLGLFRSVSRMVHDAETGQPISGGL